MIFRNLIAKGSNPIKLPRFVLRGPKNEPVLNRTIPIHRKTDSPKGKSMKKLDRLLKTILCIAVGELIKSACVELIKSACGELIRSTSKVH